jgi:uncharacterized protein
LAIVITHLKRELERDNLLYLNVKVIPKSSKTELVDILKDEEGNQTLKIKLKAVPEKGKANQELTKYLAKLFEVPKNKVTISSGKTSRTKLIKLTT